jgi:hypothetical protein
MIIITIIIHCVPEALISIINYSIYLTVRFQFEGSMFYLSVSRPTNHTGNINFEA